LLIAPGGRYSHPSPSTLHPPHFTLHTSHFLPRRRGKKEWRNEGRESNPVTRLPLFIFSSFFRWLGLKNLFQLGVYSKVWFNTPPNLWFELPAAHKPALSGIASYIKDSYISIKDYATIPDRFTDNTATKLSPMGFNPLRSLIRTATGSISSVYNNS
jgi:hypothetical protein